MWTIHLYLMVQYAAVEKFVTAIDYLDTSPG